MHASPVIFIYTLPFVLDRTSYPTSACITRAYSSFSLFRLPPFNFRTHILSVSLYNQRNTAKKKKRMHACIHTCMHLPLPLLKDLPVTHVVLERKSCIPLEVVTHASPSNFLLSFFLVFPSLAVFFSVFISLRFFNVFLERMSYVHLGRQRQALFLRLAGLRHRRSQRPAIRILRKAGADLMGFTTSLRVQIKDLKQDARLALEELEMNREAFRSAPAPPPTPPPSGSGIDLTRCTVGV